LTLVGKTDNEPSEIGTPENHNANSLCWSKSSKYLSKFKSGCVICSQSSLKEIKQATDVSYLISTSNPRLDFSKAVNTYLDVQGVVLTNHVEDHMSRTDIEIGGYCFIGPNVKIGRGTVIYPNSVIHAGTKIGENCVIKSFCSIGSEGLGYDLDPTTDEYVKFPQVGAVTMSDNVIVGPNSTIRRGALSDTTIGRGTKIGALVNIGHNCNIGENCILTCMIVTAGSSTIGDNVFIGVNSVIKNQVSVGNNVTLGQGCVLVRNVFDNETIVGNPGVNIEEYKKWSKIRQQLIAESMG
jgi:UDP-3-O-[3-hydroxymyristoyl] glucosamine N-acyltransferase